VLLWGSHRRAKEKALIASATQEKVSAYVFVIGAAWVADGKARPERQRDVAAGTAQPESRRGDREYWI
jgi:hypothetical protein